MHSLEEMIDEIRGIRQVLPGQESGVNEDFGYIGQLLEDIIFFDEQSWEEAHKDDKTLASVTAAAERYLLHLKMEQPA